MNLRMDFDVFISHSSKDKTMADAVCAKLEHAGIRCWIAPRDVPAGKTWSGEIIKAIETCKVMVLVFSANANESSQIVREVEAAVHRGKPILPMRIEDITPSDSMAFFMNSVHWLDAITEPVEAHLDQMVQAVSSLLGVDGPTLKFIPVPPAPTPVPNPRPTPTPLPLPKPAFDWKIVGAIAVAVVMVLAVVALLFHNLLHPPAPVFNSIPTSPFTTPAQPSSPGSAASAASGSSTVPNAAAVDPSMTGTWHYNTTISNLPAKISLTYNKDGTYEGETVFSDSGTYQSANGSYTATSSITGQSQQGTYTYAGPHSIQVKNVLGAVIFSPVTPQANIDPSNPVMLGTWQGTTHPPNSPPWVFTVTDNPDGTYTNQIVIDDHGTYQSANGAITARSAVLGTTSQGSYTILDQNSISLSGPLGTATWTR